MKGTWKKWCILALTVLLMLSGCTSSTYPPPSFELKVDVLKPGVLYNADFSVPRNGTFAPMKLEFGQSHTQYELVLRIADTVPGRLEREQQEAEGLIRKAGVMDFSHISLWKVIGSWGDDRYIDKLSVKQLVSSVARGGRGIKLSRSNQARIGIQCFWCTQCDVLEIWVQRVDQKVELGWHHCTGYGQHTSA